MGFSRPVIHSSIRSPDLKLSVAKEGRHSVRKISRCDQLNGTGLLEARFNSPQRKTRWQASPRHYQVVDVDAEVDDTGNTVRLVPDTIAGKVHGT
jgi:hypothetical protein